MRRALTATPLLVAFSAALPLAALNTSKTSRKGVPFDTVQEFALEACSKLFTSKPTSSTVATAHIWAGWQGDGVNMHFSYGFTLEGDVGAMDLEKCKYAFTSPEARAYNQAHSFDCDVEVVSEWYFEKEGRIYRVDVGAEETLPFKLRHLNA